MEINNIYLNVGSFNPFYIDLKKFPTILSFRSNNFRGKIKSVKEITYKERHSKINSEQQIESERVWKFSIFGDDITNCDFEYNSQGEKIKCYNHLKKITSEYKHVYDSEGNRIETKCFENGVLAEISEFRFHSGQIRRQTFSKMKGSATIFQSRTEFEYLNSLLVEKKYFETKGNGMELKSSNFFWYDENNRLKRESNGHGGCETFSYDSEGRLLSISGGYSFDFTYSKAGDLFQMQSQDRVIEFDLKGNCVSNSGKKRESFQLNNDFDYDTFGNWIKRSERKISLVPDEMEREMADEDIININAPRHSITERHIEYYS